VRLHFAKLMLDAGHEKDALAVIVSVAEEMARGGHAEAGIALLKKLEQIRKRDDRGTVPACRGGLRGGLPRLGGSLARAGRPYCARLRPPR